MQFPITQIQTNRQPTAAEQLRIDNGLGAIARNSMAITQSLSDFLWELDQFKGSEDIGLLAAINRSTDDLLRGMTAMSTVISQQASPNWMRRFLPDLVSAPVYTAEQQMHRNVLAMYTPAPNTRLPAAPGQFTSVPVNSLTRK